MIFHGAARARPQTSMASSQTDKKPRRNSHPMTSKRTISLRFQEHIRLWMAESHVPAVGIALIENGRLKEAKVFGELRKGVPAPVDTLFEVASLTKPIVTMLTLRLVASGQWNLDEPLFHYWVDPDVKDDPRHTKLTTRIVLRHQTGFPNWRWNSPSGKLAFEFEPGTKFQYSGEGFEYLRRAMEMKFGKPLEQIAGPELLTPLGMKDTRFYWDDTLDESRFALPHDKEGNPIEHRWSKSALASDRLLTTVEDYGKFAVDVIKGAGLSRKLFNEMIRPQVTVPKAGGRCSAFGLGWEVMSDLSDGEYALVHSGGDPGIRTLVILLPKSRRGLVILTNGDNGMEVCTRVVVEALDVGEELRKRS
jgi:CubicO group peptidase (beta-lactamase class C family)